MLVVNFEITGWGNKWDDLQKKVGEFYTKKKNGTSRHQGKPERIIFVGKQLQTIIQNQCPLFNFLELSQKQTIESLIGDQNGTKRTT